MTFRPELTLARIAELRSMLDQWQWAIDGELQGAWKDADRKAQADLRELLGAQEKQLVDAEAAARAAFVADVTAHMRPPLPPDDPAADRENLLVMLEIVDTAAEDGMFDELGGEYIEVVRAARETRRLTDKIRALLGAPPAAIPDYEGGQDGLDSTPEQPEAGDKAKAKIKPDGKAETFPGVDPVQAAEWWSKVE